MKPEFVKGNPLPKSLGLCTDLFAEVRDLRLAMQKVVDEVKARESEIRDHLIETIPKSDDTGVAGKKYRAQIVTKKRPAPGDWAKIHAYVQETGRFDLLQKRLSDKAVTDMWEEGQEVPGVDVFNAVEVSITKI